ncbi:hypothetical protein JXM67_01785 [candidate division WOR-3 bacterium]|nr:hypothetical protein [candidate division WOR-3 bacterium]
MGRPPKISYSIFRSLMNEVERVVFIDHEITGSLKVPREIHALIYEKVTSQEFITRIPFEHPGLVDPLVAMGVEVSARGRNPLFNIILAIVPWIIIIGFFVILLRSQNKKTERILNTLRGEDGE